MTKVADFVTHHFLAHQGSRFYDPAVKYFEGHPPDAMDPYHYIKYGLKGGGYVTEVAVVVV